MSRELLQQALDALVLARDMSYGEFCNISAVIDALRAALAEPAAPQGEPVAHIFPSDVKALQLHETWVMVYSVPVGSPDERSVPLYTAPPAAPSGEEEK